MSSPDLYFSKVYGSLAAAATGDALGYPSHDMTQDEIRRRFGGYLDDFHPPFPDNPYHPKYMVAGQITDDTIMTLVIAEAIINAGGKIDAGYIGKTLARWAQKNNIWEISPMFGPTTKKKLKMLIADEDDPVQVGTAGNTQTEGASNGSAMRISPAGLVNPGKIDEAIQLAAEVSLPTHGTQVAIAGAAAISAGIAEALKEDTNVSNVVSACLRGAREGREIGLKLARNVPAPDIAMRIDMAVSVALKATDIFEAGCLITDCVGNGLPAAESVPAAVGLFLAAGGDPELAVIAGANIGGDTDTIASMCGALAGALMGISRSLSPSPVIT